MHEKTISIELKIWKHNLFKRFNIFPTFLNDNASYYTFLFIYLFIYFVTGVNIFHIFKIMSSSIFVISLIVHFIFTLYSICICVSWFLVKWYIFIYKLRINLFFFLTKLISIQNHIGITHFFLSYFSPSY